MPELKFNRLEQRRTGGAGDQIEVSVPIPRSPSGKIYRYSPNPAAQPRLFLLGDAPPERTIAPTYRLRIRNEPGSPNTVCPYSGVIAPDSEFVHFDDVQAVKEQIIWEAKADLNDYLADFAKDFNRGRKSGGFMSISMDFKPSQAPAPLAIREDLLRDLRCEACSRAYAVYAIALFCPDCGSPNVAVHFRRESDLVRQQIALAAEQSAAHQPELAYRLMGNAHEDVLTAFETALKTVFCYLIRARLPEQAEALCDQREIGNAFQNIDRARKKFSLLEVDPFSTLTSDELEILRLNIQKRHVIGHNLGIADERYAELTKDQKPGETVSIIGDETAVFAAVCEKVVEALEVQMFPTPPSDAETP